VGHARGGGEGGSGEGVGYGGGEAVDADLHEGELLNWWRELLAMRPRYARVSMIRYRNRFRRWACGGCGIR
jgi:hypothetical protein